MPRCTHAFRPRMELLEDRTVPTLFTVTTSAITTVLDGQVSLMEAIVAANNNVPEGDAPAGGVGPDVIRFHPSLNGQTISLAGSSLWIYDDLTIAGPGADLLTVSGSNSSMIFFVLNASVSINVAISGLTLTGGNSSSDGGAIGNEENLTIADSVIRDSTASGYGGGIINYGDLKLSSTTISGNSAAKGGGIYNIGSLTLSKSTVSRNSVEAGTLFDNGGGIFNEGTLILTNSALYCNSARSGGGGIANTGTLSMTNSTLFGNSTTGNGGGIFNFGPGTITASSSTLFDNSSGNFGGAIYNNGILITTNCTLSANLATVTGGGIHNRGILTVSSCTISGNSSQVVGGIENDDGSASITGTLLAGNGAASVGPDMRGARITLAFSLVQKMGDFDFTESVPGTCIFGLDPLLGPLAFNGGPTPTHAPYPAARRSIAGRTPRDWPRTRAATATSASLGPPPTSARTSRAPPMSGSSPIRSTARRTCWSSSARGSRTRSVCDWTTAKSN